MKVKICGLTCLEDALAAIDAGADLLGFNFYPPSPRYLSIPTCARLSQEIERRAPQILRVGVFVNTPPVQVLRILEQCDLHLAQLSGDELPEDLALLDGRGFKALRPAGQQVALQRAADYARQAFPALLVDHASRDVYGGSGQKADWGIAHSLAEHYPILLAGGLNPENVAQALEAVHPWGVDVASGVESEPGVKDPAKMRKFVLAAEQAVCAG
jgi:phosphoribosylanthranilate isomerase